MDIKVLGSKEFLGKEIPVIEGGFGEGEKVVSAKTIAEIHGVELGELNRMINRNITRFNENDLINLLNGSETFRNFAKENGLIGSNRTHDVFILSERGYIKLVSMMDNSNDKKWEVMGKLIDEYFNMRKSLRVLTYEQELVLDIHAGGRKAIDANKKLIEIETEKIKQEAENELKRTKSELKNKIDKLQDGNNKMLTSGQLVDSLEIRGLTTTIFNKWLCSKGFGTYEKVGNDKKKTFKPNKNFEEYISGVGYSMTGTTRNGQKIIVTYTEDMVKRIIDKYYDEITDFTESEVPF